MLRPERMSKVSVTGAKRVMDDTIDAVHELNLLHVSEYDGSWEGFSRGEPVEGAEEASERLVVVRSLLDVLDVDRETASPDRPIDPADVPEELERVRTRANELDDRRSELQDELRSIEDRVETLAPFESLGIDLELLSGYDSVAVTVGRGDPGAVESAVTGAGGVRIAETFVADDGETAAVVVYPEDDADGEAVLSDALVGVDFEALELPDAQVEDDRVTDPSVLVDRLESRAEQLRAQHESVESEIDDLRADAEGFLLAAEEHLAVEVQKTEAPLSFATTKNSFVAEGWIPTDRVEDVRSALETAVGDHVEFEELERANYSDDGVPTDREVVDEGDRGQDQDVGAPGEPDPAAADGGVRTDGGVATTGDDSPPVVLEHSAPVEPMEILVNAADRPKYSEFDPTVLVFATFPVFFGFMIGDLAYGLLYTAAGYAMYTRFDDESIRSLGGIAMWAGGFTALFGVLYGEVFGLHVLGDVLFGGHPPMHKGLMPKYEAYATAWLLLSVFVGLLHVTLGHALGFAKTLQNHDLKHAVYENGSWILMTVGVWVWILSLHAEGPKPEFLFDVFSAGGEVTAYEVGFAGLPASVGLAGLGAFFLGIVLLTVGEGPLVVEFLQSLVNVLSYVRLMAVLLAKAGLVFVVNLLVLGAYVENKEFHYIFPGEAHGEVMFQGLFNLDGGVATVIGFLVGAVLLVIGHVFVLALGVTSAGLQSVRLQYVEFFGKFYEGGGRSYDPFGYDREYTTED